MTEDERAAIARQIQRRARSAEKAVLSGDMQKALFEISLIHDYADMIPEQIPEPEKVLDAE